jgi:midasin
MNHYQLTNINYNNISNSNDFESIFYCGLFHGLYMTVLDGLGIGLSVTRDVINSFKQTAVDQLLLLIPNQYRVFVKSEISPPTTFEMNQNEVKFGSFSLNRLNKHVNISGEINNSEIITDDIHKHHHDGYVFNSKMTILNSWRISRALQIPRPVLLEGPPGVGKSSIVSNIAKLLGKKLIRINLSEQSEISDLLGSDLPSSNSVNNNDNKDIENVPKFIFCEGAFLTAMKQGHWVLLDELNLAPQSVLEGLNACLDHRGEVFIPEIGKFVYFI